MTYKKSRAAVVAATMAFFVISGCKTANSGSATKNVTSSADFRNAIFDFSEIEHGTPFLLEWQQSKIPAMLFESIGNSRFEVMLEAGIAPDEWLLQGPFEPGKDWPIATQGTASEKKLSTSKNNLAFLLDQPGIYRLFPNVSTAGRIKFTANCAANCFRTAIKPEDLKIDGSSNVEKLLAGLSVVAPGLDGAQVRQKIAGINRRSSPDTIDRATVFTISQLNSFFKQPQYVPGSQAGSSPQDPGPFTAETEFFSLMKNAVGSYYQPVPTAEGSDFSTGSWARFAMPKNQIGQSNTLADLINSLALNKVPQIKASVAGEQIVLKSPGDILSVLQKTGHTITLTSEKMFSDIVHVVYKGRPVRWAFWLDTKVKDRNGDSLVVPMAHSHFAWRVSGPLVNAKIMFYLGNGGIGFFPDTYASIDWWMHYRDQTIQSDSTVNSKVIIKAIETAFKYHHYNQDINKTLQYPNDGYGILGVCNDSHAVVNEAIGLDLLTYPLMRDPTLPGVTPADTTLRAAFENLPADIVATDGDIDETSIVRRLRHSFAGPGDLSQLFDAKLKTQWEEFKLTR